MMRPGIISVKNMINPETGKPMKDLSTELQDIGMIDRKIVDDAKEIREKQQNPKTLNNLIIEAFTQRLAAQTEDTEDIATIPSDRFQEDTFEYQRWQLEICRYIKGQKNYDSFSEIKTRILRHGLKQISQDL